MCPNTGVLETVNALWIIHDKFVMGLFMYYSPKQNQVEQYLTMQE